MRVAVEIFTNFVANFVTKLSSSGLADVKI